jgi:hypothetical protein
MISLDRGTIGLAAQLPISHASCKVNAWPTTESIFDDLKCRKRPIVSADVDFEERHPRRHGIDAASFDGLPLAPHVGRPLLGRSTLASR